MPDDVEPRRPAADKGTGLGASTNALTRLFAVLLWPIAAIPRAGHALGRVVGRVVRRVFGGEHRLLRRLALLVGACAALIGRACHAVVHVLGRVLAPIGVLFRIIGTAIARVADIIGTAVASVATILGRAIARVATTIWTAFVRALAAVARPVGRAIAIIWSACTRVIARAARACYRMLAAVATAIGTAIRRVAAVVGPPVARALTAVGLVILCVLVAPFALLYWAVRALRQPFLVAGRALLRPIRAAAHSINVVVGPPARAFVRALAAVAREVADSGRAMGRHIVFTGRRVAHSVGVAFLRARLMNAHARSPNPDAAPTGDDRPAPQVVPFAAAVHQNEYLPVGARDVHAIITVTASATAGGADTDARPEAAEVILLDCSGSMGHPWQKLRAARRATQAAVEALRDGTWFAIVRASHEAEAVYPMGGGLVRATDETRVAAVSALGLLWPEGGTAMGRWLALAGDLFATQPHAIPHAILLTDGKNESESSSELDTALTAVAGRFQCDCRGVGTDWDVAELRTVSSRMLGTVDIVADPENLAADFEAMMAAAMAKRVGDARLRVWTPQGAVVRSLQQVAPEIQDITTQRRPVDRLTGEYATGAWGDESRDYHLCVRVPDKGIGAEMLAARVSLVVGDHVAASSLVRAIWTDDEEIATVISPQVAHYTGQSELATLIQEGVGARRAGNDELATEKLGRAAQVAAASGNDATLQLLANVVDVVDAPTGRVRLKQHVELADEMALDTRSGKTVRTSAV